MLSKFRNTRFMQKLNRYSNVNRRLKLPGSNKYLLYSSLYPPAFSSSPVNLPYERI